MYINSCLAASNAGCLAENLECNVTYYTNSSLPKEAVVSPVVNVVLAFSVVAIARHAIMQFGDLQHEPSCGHVPDFLLLRALDGVV